MFTFANLVNCELQLHKLGSSLTQSMASVQVELSRLVRETENNLEHQISMLVQDNGVFSCAISRLLDLMPNLESQQRSGSSSATTTELFLDEDEEDDDHVSLTTGNENGNATTRQLLLQGNSIQTADLLSIDQLMAGINGTKCNLKCP